MNCQTCLSRSGLIDQQTGTMLGVQDFRLDSFRRNVLTIAGVAKLHKLPTVLTGSYVEGPNGPIMGELLEMFPDAPTILRPGPISAWDDPNAPDDRAVRKQGLLHEHAADASDPRVRRRTNR
jgi:hypothetical protein